MENIELRKIYKRKKSDRDLFQALMPYKMREILLISTYYDAYTIEGDGQFTDKIMGEYLQVNLYTAPHFTFVANESEAVEVLQKRHINLIVIMAGLDKDEAVRMSRNIKDIFPLTPQLLLVNNNTDLAYFERMEKVIAPSIERTFVWNGSARIFLAMVKYMEDKLNVERDTKLGDVGVLLLVEDSISYYSNYLPILYSEIVSQTQDVIKADPKNKDMSLVMKIRTRPKVLLATTYESAVTIIDRYRTNLIGVISDVSYFKDGSKCDSAGADLIRYVHSLDESLPCLLQSMEEKNRELAEEVNATFCNKNSATLASDIKNFINRECGFGDFVFRNAKGEEIDRAVSLDDLREKLQRIPAESLKYHALRNDFSAWFMARGEVRMAKHLHRYRLSDFTDTEDMRTFFLKLYDAIELKELKGQVVLFNEGRLNSNHFITRIGYGSLGGKGRGLAFLCNFIENADLWKLIPGLPVVIPKTSVIAVDEFSRFVEYNNIDALISSDASYEELKEAFLKGKIPDDLHELFRRYLRTMKKPLAVRSSGMFEDSLNQPFAGVYSSYFIPNNSPDEEERLLELETAVKLVWSSIYTDNSRAYFKAINCIIEEEKMAVILQEVVGSERNGKYYPNMSGVAQSYNFYPFSYIKPTDGFGVLALGLGAFVVGGEKTYRFCPAYPKLQNASIKDSLRDTQKHFYAVNLGSGKVDLANGGEAAAIAKFDIDVAEKDGALEHCASIYDIMNERISYDFSDRGPRIVNFAGVLQFGDIPVARALEVLLNIFQQTMGAPVEIEFAIDKDEGVWKFYLLQIKPLIKQVYDTSVDESKIKREDTLLRAEKGMGNGVLSDLCDILYIDPERFDKLKTEEMAKEVQAINAKMVAEGRRYVLIGPGRWGTRDPLTGIPVLWSDISMAKVIVEQGLEDYPLDASLGSHFFHNVTTMSVGYFAVPNQTSTTFIDFEKISALPLVEESNYVKHVRSEKPFSVLMDGKRQVSLIVLGGGVEDLKDDLS